MPSQTLDKGTPALFFFSSSFLISLFLSPVLLLSSKFQNLRGKRGQTGQTGFYTCRVLLDDNNEAPSCQAREVLVPGDFSNQPLLHKSDQEKNITFFLLVMHAPNMGSVRLIRTQYSLIVSSPFWNNHLGDYVNYVDLIYDFRSK